MQTDPPEPKPRVIIEPYRPYLWPNGGHTLLKASPLNLAVDLAKLAQERRSRREFGIVSTDSLAYLLALCCRAHSTCSSTLGFDQEFRSVPSAGAVHPIHVLVQRIKSGGWARYNSVEHRLDTIPSSKCLAMAARREADEIVPSGDATLLALVAEPGKTRAKYQQPETLVWRDAGVIIGSMALVAEALGLNFCPLGATGSNYVAPLAPPGTFFGAGLLLIGSRP